MTRRARTTPTTVVVLVAPVLLALAACAGRAGATPTPTPTSTEPADPAVVAQRVAPVGIAPDLVYVTDLDGFDLATQSVGVVGDEGMSAAYVRVDDDGVATVMLMSARAGQVTGVPCADLPDTAEPPVRCVVDRGAATVLLEGDVVDAATVRAAGAAVRLPYAHELDDLFSELPTPGPPVQRGDLPPEGDGAPMDPPALGG